MCTTQVAPSNSDLLGGHHCRRTACPSRCRRSRDCLNLRALWAYTKLAVPSSAMTCLEWWACECQG